VWLSFQLVPCDKVVSDPKQVRSSGTRDRRRQAQGDRDHTLNDELEHNSGLHVSGSGVSHPESAWILPTSDLVQHRMSMMYSSHVACCDA
jgi:hypothetical protein